MANPNDLLMDQAIRNILNLQGFSNAEVKKVVELINSQVLSKITNATTTGLLRSKSKSNISRLTKRNNKIIKDGYTTIYPEYKGDLFELSRIEAGLTVNALEKSLPFSVNFNLPDAGTLRAIVTSEPFQGKLLRKWWSGLARDAQDRIAQQINMGIIQGESVPNIVRRLTGTSALNFTDGAYKTIRRNAESTVRTSINHVSNSAREHTYEANSNVIASVQYVATLDARTTDICAGLDGQQFQIQEGPRPPMHHQCRSTTVPVTKSFKELGFTGLNEIKSGRRASRTYTIGKGQRVKVDTRAQVKKIQDVGGTAPAKQTYGTWLKKQPKTIQNKVLGKGRAELFRDGLPIDKFTNNRNMSLSLGQLEKLGV